MCHLLLDQKCKLLSLNAASAQPAWAAQNPQRRARVFMKFVELVNANMNDLARMLSSEHGKTLSDAQGDIQRGLEVSEFVIGIPHLLKGEYSTGVGTGISRFIPCVNRWALWLALPPLTSPR